MELLFHEDVKNLVEKFKGKYTLVDYGFPKEGYRQKGFWIHLKANFDIRVEEYRYCSANFCIKKRDVYVTQGFLKDIEYGLTVLMQ